MLQIKKTNFGLAATVALLVAPAAGADTAIVAGGALMPDGTISSDVTAVLIADDGTIAAVGATDELIGRADTVHRYPGAVISPGLIELASGLGLGGESRSGVGTIQPDIAAIDALDPTSSDLTEAMHAGITGAMLVPAPVNAVSGRAAFVRTNGDVVTEKGALICSVAPSTVNTLYGPSSRAGVAFELRRALQDAGKDSVISKARDGKLNAVVVCGSADDAMVGLTAFAVHGAVPTFTLRDGGLDFQPAMDQFDPTPSAIVGPYGIGDRPETLAGPGALSRSGAGLGFTNSGLEPGTLRRSAAIACRYGLTPEAARRGLTSDAAKIAGMEGKLGTLEAGAWADIAVFSLDPLRLDAEVLAVFIAGEMEVDNGTGAAQ